MSLLMALVRAAWLAWWDRIYYRLAGPTVIAERRPGTDDLWRRYDPEAGS